MRFSKRSKVVASPGLQSQTTHCLSCHPSGGPVILPLLPSCRGQTMRAQANAERREATNKTTRIDLIGTWCATKWPDYTCANTTDSQRTPTLPHGGTKNTTSPKLGNIDIGVNTQRQRHSASRHAIASRTWAACRPLARFRERPPAHIQNSTTSLKSRIEGVYQCALRK